MKLRNHGRLLIRFIRARRMLPGRRAAIGFVSSDNNGNQ